MLAKWVAVILILASAHSVSALRRQADQGLPPDGLPPGPASGEPAAGENFALDACVVSPAKMSDCYVVFVHVSNPDFEW